MSLWKRGRQYWTDFTVAGRRYRKRLGTTNLRVATRRERELIEEAGHGRLNDHEQGPHCLSVAIEAYLTAKRIRCSPRTIELEKERLSLVTKHFGDVPLSAITAKAIAEFQHTRHDAGIANRTINMDVGVLSRVLKFCGRWRALADHVKNLPQRQRPVGRALTPEERRRLFDAAASNAEWEHVYCAAVVAANTSMRPVEVKHLRRRDVDLVKRLVHVRRSKNETSHRVIPLNASAIEAAARMFERADLLGHTEPEHYLWPACQWGRYDATNPMLKWDTAWRALRDAASLPGLRFHDLRHTVITELAEMGVADHVLESISGHLSRRMLEHYSHIRIDAKRQALDALDAARRSTAHNDDGNGNGADQTEIPAIVEVSDDLTSQSRHSLLLRGSPPAGKLLIPLARRDVRVVEGARLEIDFGGACKRTPKRTNALSTKDFPQQRCASECPRKSRCFTVVWGASDTVLTQDTFSLIHAETKVACPQVIAEDSGMYHNWEHRHCPVARLWKAFAGSGRSIAHRLADDFVRNLDGCRFHGLDRHRHVAVTRDEDDRHAVRCTAARFCRLRPLKPGRRQGPDSYEPGLERGRERGISFADANVSRLPARAAD